MSQVRNKRQNNIRAGVFVTISIFVGFVVFSILTNAWDRMFKSVSSYVVVFPVEEGVGALASGSPVRLGGVIIGSVTDVTPIVNDGEPTTNIEIRFQVEQDFHLYDNATIFAKSGLLGSTSWLSIVNVGSGTQANESIALSGTTQSMVTQLLGDDAEINISKSLDALRRLSEALAVEDGAIGALLGSEDAAALKSAIHSARASLSSIETITEMTETQWEEWQASVSILLEDAKQLPAEVKATLNSVQETIQQIQSDVLQNAELTMESLNSTMQNLEVMSGEFKTSSPRWSNDVSTTLRNFKNISTRAKVAIDEISASPWRLLYRPTDREVAYEQLNAASWNLLSSLQELSDVTSEMESLSKSSAAPEEAQELAELLRESVVRFDQARGAMLQQMQQDFPNR
ncbi:MAG: hypothetical protein VX615_03820 [Planctomycetota bacterium]|nr:hypothetical protein [Planctomycetota bacterium]